MGVHHLNHHSNAAKGAKGSIGGSPSATNIQGRGYMNPAPSSAANNVPTPSGVKSLSHQALRPGNAPAQPPKGNSNGGRAGAKSGQPRIGSRGAAKGMSGGRAN